jgi:hypothetical protein
VKFTFAINISNHEFYQYNQLVKNKSTLKKVTSLFYLLIYFGVSGDRTQGLVLARQALYLLSHTLNPTYLFKYNVAI